MTNSSPLFERDENGEDPWHKELKDSRMPDSAPRVQKCLLTCAKATREGGQKRNECFESIDADAKKFLEDYDKEVSENCGRGSPKPTRAIFS